MAAVGSVDLSLEGASLMHPTDFIFLQPGGIGTLPDKARATEGASGLGKQVTERIEGLTYAHGSIEIRQLAHVLLLSN